MSSRVAFEAHVFVGVEHDVAFFGFERDRNDLRLEVAALDRLRAARRWRFERELVLRLAADAVFLRDVFGGDAHVDRLERVVQRAEHHVDHVRVAHALAPACGGQRVRRAAHVFGAAADGHLGVAELDALRGGHDRLQSRAAQAVDGQRRRLLRDSRRRSRRRAPCTCRAARCGSRCRTRRARLRCPTRWRAPALRAPAPPSLVGGTSFRLPPNPRWRCARRLPPLRPVASLAPLPVSENLQDDLTSAGRASWRVAVSPPAAVRRSRVKESAPPRRSLAWTAPRRRSRNVPPQKDRRPQRCAR